MADSVVNKKLIKAGSHRSVSSMLEYTRNGNPTAVQAVNQLMPILYSMAGKELEYEYVFQSIKGFLEGFDKSLPAHPRDSWEHDRKREAFEEWAKELRMVVLIGVAVAGGDIFFNFGFLGFATALVTLAIAYWMLIQRVRFLGRSSLTGKDWVPTIILGLSFVVLGIPTVDIGVNLTRLGLAATVGSTTSIALIGLLLVILICAYGRQWYLVVGWDNKRRKDLLTAWTLAHASLEHLFAYGQSVEMRTALINWLRETDDLGGVKLRIEEMAACEPDFFETYIQSKTLTT